MNRIMVVQRDTKIDFKTGEVRVEDYKEEAVSC
jgi:hypothetical protein